MADTERLLLFLAGGDPEVLLDDVRRTRSPALLQYARSWLSLIAQEFRAELQSALATARGADEGSRATKALQWQATVIERVADTGAGVYSVAMKPPAARSDGECDPLGAPPPRLHRLLWSQGTGTLLFVSEELGGTKSSPMLRCLLLEADSLHGEGRRAGPQLASAEPGAVLKCVEAASVHAAINRCRALCSLDRLSDPLRAAIVPADNVPHSDGSLGWREWPPPAAADRGDARLLGWLSASQLGAVGGVRGAVNLLHGVPASGKASVLAAVAASRTPTGALVLAVARSGHKLASLAHKLDEAGVAPLLLIAPPPTAAETSGGMAGGSGGATGEARQDAIYGEARRHTMAAQLAREPHLNKLEARVAVAAQGRAEAEARYSGLKEKKKKKDKAEKKDDAEDACLVVSRQVDNPDPNLPLSLT